MSSWASDLIKLEDLAGDQRDLAEIIGIEAYVNLVCEWGRDSVYIGKCDSVIKSRRNEQIVKEFLAGSDTKFLARKYKLTQRTINLVLYAARQRAKRTPGAGQLSLFEP